MMTKVNERLEETDDWEVVKDHIITLDRAAVLSKHFLNNPTGRRREFGALAQSSKKAQCMACGRKGHKQAECKVDKEKLQCSFCKTTKSHMTKVCQKKAKEKKDPPKETPPKKVSNPRSKSPKSRKRDLSNHKPRDTSEEGETSNIVQHFLTEECQTSDPEPEASGQEYDSDDEPFITPPESPVPIENAANMPPLSTSSD